MGWANWHCHSIEITSFPAVFVIYGYVVSATDIALHAIATEFAQVFCYASALSEHALAIHWQARVPSHLPWHDLIKPDPTPSY